ncbi:cytochrome c-type biogenesis protein [Bartonella choladocola]|uniref:Cytochrome c-type biogenesis protein n=1 Tax=Bartonella choladocola TaxID=2750995 RepID=A0A1U9MG07_9HYPH|nr:cytochrome c-type biogenesis protein [Bartonella choladocola]AQT46897.1 cytochrome c-type biogenesis protein CcmH [Bartonella choladocola]
MRFFPRLLAAFAFICFMNSAALAVLPDEVLQDQALEQRARDISSHLRCLVCQNESIDDSNAPLARDLRLLVRERLKSGDTDSQVVDYLVARYGEFVLLKPRLNGETLLLWLAPLLIIVIAGSSIIWRVRRHKHNKLMPLSEAEKRQLDRILKSKNR